MPGREEAEREAPLPARHFVGPTPEQRSFLLPLMVPRGGYQSDPYTLARLLEGLAVPGNENE